MKLEYIKVPYLGVNDDECELTKWNVINGQAVSESDLVCVVETTKTAMDLEAEFSGYVYMLAEKNERLKVGLPLAIISTEKLDEARLNELKIGLNNVDDNEILKPIITKKAELLAKKNNIDVDLLIENFVGERITEKYVMDILKEQVTVGYQRGFCDLERIAIIGGASGGGALIIVDSLLKSLTQRPAVVLDRDEIYHGKSILGVPVLGGIDLLSQLLKTREVDSVVIAINRNVDERAAIFEQLKATGVRFANVVDPSANLRSNIKMGVGNVVLGSTYIGACCIIGDNNFISSNVCLEHGNTLGDHCAFGPGVFTSGNVSIGNNVRFGTGIHVEPNLKIGSGSIVSSGATILSNVPNNSVVRVLVSQETKLIK